MSIDSIAAGTLSAKKSTAFQSLFARLLPSIGPASAAGAPDRLPKGLSRHELRDIGLEYDV